MDTRAITRPTEAPDDAELERRRLATAHRLLRAHPAEIGRYRVVGKIGEGGMGVVYRAHDPRLDRPVAIKVLDKPAVEAADIEQQLRMLREARALAAVSHPNVIEIYEVGEHRGTPFLAMEYVDGTSLRDVIDYEAPPWDVVVRTFVDAGHGLAAAHERGLVHRDFKPSNVLLGRDGRVRVLDFGLAKGLCEPSSSASDGAVSASGPRDPTPSDRTPGRAAIELTEAGTLLGTPAYMAPEQLRGAGADAASDQFAFCVSLWEGLFGRRPFRGRNPKELRAAIERGRPTRPRRHDVPASIVRALRRGLDADPAARWPRLSDLLRELERGLAGRRRWRWAAGGLFGIAAVVVVWPARSPSCVRPDPPLPAWTQRDREAIGLDDEARVRVEPTLDDYAQQLDVGWSRLCALESGEGDVEAARSCLQERTAAAETIVGLLGEATGPEVSRMLASLHDVDGCFALVPGPRPPAAGLDAVRELDGKLARAGVLHLADRTDEAIALQDEVVAKAEAMPWPPIVARALVGKAAVLVTLGRQDDARAALERAFDEASGAGDHPTAKVAAHRLAEVLGVEMSRGDEALQWARHSEAAARRAGEADPQAHLHATLGMIHTYAGNADEALRHLERATELLVARPDMTVRELQNTHRRLGGLLLNLGRAEQARAHFEQALALAEASAGPHAHDVAALSFNLGLATEVATRDHAAAHRLYMRAVEVYREHFEGDHPDVADALFHAGTSLAALHRFDEAEPLLREGLAMFVRTLGDDDVFVAQARIELAELLHDAGRPEQAREVLGTATTGLEARVGREHPLVARGYRLLGGLALADGDLAVARRHLETALAALAGDDGVSTETRVATLELLADVALAAGDTADAVVFAERTLGEVERVGMPDASRRAALVSHLNEVIAAAR